MFESLSNRLSHIVQNINRRSSLTEKNIKDILKEVRIALLEADVALPVVRSFIDTVKTEAIGHVIRKGLTASQEFTKIVHTALVQAMGSKDLTLNLSVQQPPAVLLITGFQGAGKTTTCAKLARYLHIKKRKKVLLSSVDIYRPSGIRQLEILANTSGVDFFEVKDYSKSVINIVSDVLVQAKLGFYDILLIDTVGCLSTDVDLIKELSDLAVFLNPLETLFVVDAMLGQESVNIASFFSSKLPLTGIILTKVDGDSRGGVALSIYHTINQPIKFIGTGEKIDALEPFYASRMASRILGMGDVLSLIEDIESKVDKVHIKNTMNKLNKGDTFDLSDFLNHLQQMRNIGGINRIVGKLPIINNDFSNALKLNIDDKVLMTMEVIINSMTVEERKYPNIIQDSRKKRISYGAGVSIKDINMLMKRFFEVQSVMKKISAHGLSKMLHILQNKLSSKFFMR